MKFFEGPGLILILVAALIILGPDKLPQLGKVLGRTIRSVREGLGLAAAETERDPEKPTVNKEE